MELAADKAQKHQTVAALQAEAELQAAKVNVECRRIAALPLTIRRSVKSSVFYRPIRKTQKSGEVRITSIGWN
jgi:hypothetical protein